MFKSLNWLLLIFITAAPLFPQNHFLDTQFKSHGFLAANLLTVVSGFSSYYHYRPGFIQTRVLPLIYGSIPLLCLAILCIIVNFNWEELWRINPLAMILAYPTSAYIPLIHFAYSLMCCWLTVPVQILLWSKLSLSARLVLIFTLPVLTSLLMLVTTRSLYYDNDTSSIYVHPVFKLPLFTAGCLTASVVPSFEAIYQRVRSRFMRGFIVDCSFALWTYFLLVRRHSASTYIKGSTITVYLILAFLALQGVEDRLAKNSIGDEEWRSAYSLSTAVLQSEPLTAVLEGQSINTFALIYKLILYLYSPLARDETLKGHGFLCYVSVVLLCCHLYSYYVWTPISQWAKQGGSIQKDTSLPELVHSIFIRPDMSCK